MKYIRKVTELTKQKAKERSRLWYKNNKVYVIERQKKDYIKNKERIDKRNTEWARKNKTKSDKIKKRFVERHPIFMIFSSMRSRCTSRKIFLGFDKESFENWYTNKPKICEYCRVSEEEWKINGDPLSKTKYGNRLQLDRVIPHIGYTIDNTVFACPRCNTIKSNFFSYEQMLIIGKMISENSKLAQYRTQNISV